MNENIKTAAKISGKTALKWFFIFATGNLVTLATFLIALFTNIGVAGTSTRVGVIGLFIGLLTTNLFAFVLVFGMPIFLVLYFVLANKISIQNALYLLWKGKSGDYIVSKVGALTKKLTEKEGWRKELSNKAIIKGEMLQLAKNDPGTSKLQHKIINFGFKKIKLDEIDFQDKNLNLAAILTNKFNTLIEQTAKPSLKLFWILVIIQIGFLIGSTMIK